MQPVRGQARSSRCPVDGLVVIPGRPLRRSVHRHPRPDRPRWHWSRRPTMISPFSFFTPPTARRVYTARPVGGLTTASGARWCGPPTGRTPNERRTTHESNGSTGGGVARRAARPVQVMRDQIVSTSPPASMTFTAMMAAVSGAYGRFFPHRTAVRRPAQCSVSHHLDRTQ